MLQLDPLIMSTDDLAFQEALFPASNNTIASFLRHGASTWKNTAWKMSGDAFVIH